MLIHSLPNFYERAEMPLTRVTMTGADDSTNPDELLEISKEYPFVEWAILVGSRCGGRFPSLHWISRLCEAARQKTIKPSLSLHVCGLQLEQIAAGAGSLHHHIGGVELIRFQRLQLNWHGERQADSVDGCVRDAFLRMQDSLPGWMPEIIFQLDGVNDHLMRKVIGYFRCSGLFDRSHGAGVVPDKWPAMRSDLLCGWAGGLGPDNLAEEMPKINALVPPRIPYWIDMETKVRNQHGFDLDAVRQCLEIAKPFVGSRW